MTYDPKPHILSLIKLIASKTGKTQDQAFADILDIYQRFYSKEEAEEIERWYMNIKKRQ